MIWRSRGNKKFAVKDCYADMIGRGNIIEKWPWKLVWMTKIPTIKWPDLDG